VRQVGQLPRIIRFLCFVEERVWNCITFWFELKDLEISNNVANNFIFNQHVTSNETSRIRAKLWANEEGDVRLFESDDGIVAT